MVNLFRTPISTDCSFGSYMLYVYVSIFMKSCKHFIIKNTTNISNLTVLLSIIRLLGNCVKVAHSDLLMLCINEKSIKFQQDISNIYIFKRSWHIINMKSTTLQKLYGHFFYFYFYFTIRKFLRIICNTTKQHQIERFLKNILRTVYRF